MERCVQDDGVVLFFLLWFVCFLVILHIVHIFVSQKIKILFFKAKTTFHQTTKATQVHINISVSCLKHRIRIVIHAITEDIQSIFPTHSILTGVY